MKFRKILGLFLFLSLVAGGGILYYRSQNATSAKACGSFDCDWGDDHHHGDPIFDEDDFKPGDCVTKTVTIKNKNSIDAMAFVKAIKTKDKDKLSEVLSIVISDITGDLYGGDNGEKTVNNFFIDSKQVGGIPLSTVLQKNEKVYSFEVCFDIDAGNEYQKTKLVFDLQFGVNGELFELPEECKYLEGSITKIIEGTSGNDNIKGTPAGEYIIGNGGDDKLDGSAGNDCIFGDNGKDKLTGGSGNDVIVAKDGKDNIDGGSGEDHIYSGKGNDSVTGGSENDLIFADEGDDSVDGGSGDDIIYGGKGLDNLKGGSGKDKVYGEDDKDTIKGDSGDDLLDGGTEQDNINGNSGTDTCVNGETLASCEL